MALSPQEYNPKGHSWPKIEREILKTPLKYLREIKIEKLENIK